MARAAAMGLPSSLDNLGSALKLAFPKDKLGHTLMMKMCKPKTRDPLTWHEDPKDVERLVAYCDRDVETETDADAHLPPLTERERRVWILDQRINDRGFGVDLRLVQRADACVAAAKLRADADIWRATNGAVKKATQAKALADWINSQGVPCTSVADGEIDELIVGADLVDRPDVAEALGIRRSSAGAFKFEAMLRAVCSDGRIRGSLAYHGTHGGRWAGRVVQPQNFKRLDTDEEAEAVQQALTILRTYDKPDNALDAMAMTIDLPPLEVLSLCARPMIVSQPGHVLRDADFSNIEGRLAAWFAGAAWKIDAFRAFDLGLGPDLYKVTASDVLSVLSGKPVAVESITREQRQENGKVSELSCQFQGAKKAIQKQAAKLGLNMSDAQATAIAQAWRNANPEIVEAWPELQQAAIDAVQSPGMMVPVLGGKVRYLKPRDQDFLWCCLPSGRVISYANPVVGWSTKFFTEDGDLVSAAKVDEVVASGKSVEGSSNFGLTYWGQKSGRFLKIDMYGGMQFAHIVSGTARDLLVEAMFATDAAGHNLILTIHDELLVEDPVGFRSLEEFEETIRLSKPRWADGLPMVSKAWEDVRYVK